ncbi:MAG: TadE/TadG family type IV pilus assembly protein [Dehalococcoidia bacterium]|jgi:Flp pilus assembly protein TadG
MRPSRNLKRAERGQTLIEFALVAPMILLFLFMIIDFGIAMDRRIVLQHAVREGARYAAVNGQNSLDSVKQRTVDQAQGIIKTSDVRITYTDMSNPADGTTTDVGDSVDVQVCFTYDPVIIRPILSGLFGGTLGAIKMNVTGSARLEQKALSPPGDAPCP